MSPFIIKPTRIRNYTQLITLLKLKQMKYKDYKYTKINNTFSDVLSTDGNEFVLEDIIEGYMHEELVKHFKSYEKEIEDEFDKKLERKMKEIKKKKEEETNNVRIGSIGNDEEMLFGPCSKYSFKDVLLYDLYVYLNKRKKAIDFLEETYIRYIKEFMTVKKHGKTCEESNLKTLIEQYVKLRFNRDEYCIEVYNGRFLWAEVFVLYRIGRVDIVKELLAEHEMFFEFMGHKFKSAFLEYLGGRSSSYVYKAKQADDKFKKILFGMAEGNGKSDGIVIGTMEDYLWMKLKSGKEGRKEILHEIGKIKNTKLIFMAYLLLQKYKKAVEVLLKSDFNFIAKFYLLRELCLEQALDIEETGFASTSKPMLKNERNTLVKNDIYDDSSSFSLVSEKSDFNHGLAETNPLFLNFIFGIVKKLSNNERKVRLVEMLQNYGDYYSVIPYYIIKYELFEIVGKSGENDFNYYLDNEICGRVVKQLMESNAKNKLIKLWKLIPDEEMGGFLIDVLEEAILIDEHIDLEIVENYIKKLKGDVCCKLKGLSGIYKFVINPTIANLKNTIIFDFSVDLEEYKFAIEKILPKIIEIVKLAADHEMAKRIFKLGGILNLSEENCDRIARELIMII